MNWNRYGRGTGWDKLGEAIAMMAMNNAAGMGSPGKKMRWHFDSEAGEDDEGGPGRRRHRHGRMFAQGELRLALLALIAEKPSHGYELIRQIEDMTSGAYAPSPGAVYPTLQLLGDEGAIAEAEEAGPKRPFAATDAGRAELEERKDEVERLMRRLGRLAERTTTMRSHDLFRAMGNLGSVLRNRARAGKFDEGTVNDIVDMIDEMAKRIERL